VLLLLGKDLRVVRRTPILLAALIVYPLVIALLVGLLVRHAGERPRVALVDQAGLSSSILLGNRRFDLRRLFEEATEVKFERMSREQAAQALDTGRVVATITVPRDFTVRLRRLRESPSLTLRTTEDAFGARVGEKMRALVYAVNLKLQQAFIEANLSYIDLLERGGQGRIGETELDLIGLGRAQRLLEEIARSPDPGVAADARVLADFLEQVEGGVGQVGAFLRATANPVRLVVVSNGGRTWLLSAQVQAYALAISLAFVAVLLGAAVVTTERAERTIGRLVRGLAGLGHLVVEKVLLVACVGTVLSLALALVFGAIVELGSVTGGEPWERLPLLAIGLVLASAAFGALGVALGTLARDASGAMLVAMLVTLPVTVLGLLPQGSVPAADWIASLVPFGHVVDYAQAALYDPDPGSELTRAGAWLLGLGVAYTAAARLLARRLLL
jgi:ABC-2 type transport system permease protein